MYNARIIDVADRTPTIAVRNPTVTLCFLLVNDGKVITRPDPKQADECQVITYRIDEVKREEIVDSLLQVKSRFEIDVQSEEELRLIGSVREVEEMKEHQTYVHTLFYLLNLPSRVVQAELAPEVYAANQSTMLTELMEEGRAFQLTSPVQVALISGVRGYIQSKKPQTLRIYPVGAQATLAFPGETPT